ncbi:MAG TPA: cadherin-like domain-containing protein, partial [Saprospiraceae bacterium]|nr:cadherin-like domain-containing protein [Saprospiraceae bacterium]
VNSNSVSNISVVAHEMGHQFGANHTFNNCGENIAAGNDFEPGSGSTIMSYGGLCGSNNVVTQSDAYYHNASLIEIYNYMRDPASTGFSCANAIVSNNEPPKITKMPESGRTIPFKTPFILQGTAIDAKEDTLTYCWEQKDANLKSTPLGSPTDNAPIFRSFPPNGNNYRVFPSASNVISNVNSINEILPTYKRSLNFALSVRDNNSETGLATWEFVKMDVTDQAGPFTVLSPNAPMTIKAGEPLIISWDVANTNLSPVSCKNVDIYLSLDGVLDPENEKMILISSKTANDGEATIFLPDVTTSNARIMVKASDNFFFDINNVNLTITPTEKQGALLLATVNETKLCLPNTSNIGLSTKSVGAYSGDVSFAIKALPEGIQSNFLKSTEKVGIDNVLQLTFSNDVSSGLYEIVLYAIDSENDTTFQTITYEVTSTNFDDLSLVGPETGTKNFEGLPTFTWTSAFNADTYTLEVSKDPRFLQDQIEISIATPDTVKLANKTLDKAEIYYWRVKASNSCGSVNSEVFAFGTEVLACKTYAASDLPQNLSQSGRPTIESKILIGDNFNITDLNVKSVNIDHDNFKDLKGTLISPTNIAVILWNNQCPRRMNINFGFDNDAPSIFTCATTANAQYKAVESLDTFNNTASNGTWTLKVEDLVAGNGGSLKGLEIELCGNLEVDNPTVSTNTLKVEYQKTGSISKSFLEALNGNTTPENLVYKIVNDVSFGMITKSGNLLSVGETFSQADVNAGIIVYQNVGPELGPSENATDVLKIIVENGVGGWAGVIDFNILIENTTVSTKDDLFQSRLTVYPVPADEEITFVVPDVISAKGRYIIYDLNGKMVMKGNSVDGLNKVNVSQIATGQYFIQVAIEQNILTGRFTKVDN